MLYRTLRLLTTIIHNSNQSNFLTYPYTQPQAQLSEEISDLSYPIHPLQPRFPLDSRPRSPIPSTFDMAKGTSTGLLSPPSSNASPDSTTSVPSGIVDLVYPQSHGSKLQRINDRVAVPYDYTEGYHFLMKHLPTRCVVPYHVSAEPDITSGHYIEFLSSFQFREERYPTDCTGVGNFSPIVDCTPNAVVPRR